jgi:hypothetical protein
VVDLAFPVQQVPAAQRGHRKTGELKRPRRLISSHLRLLLRGLQPRRLNRRMRSHHLLNQ